MTRSIWVYVLAASFLSCKSEFTVRPYGYLNLKVEGQEEPIRWEVIVSKWTNHSGEAELEASGYAFDHCTIHLDHVTDTGSISSLTLRNFSYTDGLHFRPYALSGTLTIT